MSGRRYYSGERTVMHKKVELLSNPPQSSDDYRNRAKRVRRLADNLDDTTAKQALRELASEYDLMADRLEAEADADNND